MNLKVDVKAMLLFVAGSARRVLQYHPDTRTCAERGGLA